MSDAYLNWGKFYLLESNKVAGGDRLTEARLAIADEVVEGPDFVALYFVR
jgi:hypothetical protein